jgi:hypothetical protein
MRYAAAVLLVLSLMGVTAVGVALLRATSSLHKPYRFPLSRQGRGLLFAAFVGIVVFTLAGYGLGYLLSSGLPSHRVNVGAISANAGFFLALLLSVAIHRLIKHRIPPATDDQIRAYRKYQRDTSWLGPGSIPPDPPTAPPGS